MILRALDLLRELGWGIINLIYSFIDSIYEIITKINELDIVGTMADNAVFSKFYKSVIVIALTIFGLFITWQFVKKILDPDEGPSVNQILTEIFKCGLLLFLSTFLFVQISTFSIQLSGYVSTIMKLDSNTTYGSEILSNYIDYDENYKKSENFENDDYKTMIKNGTFGSRQHYNDKYVVKDRFIRSDERDYKFKVQWIMAILCGGFFLYALIFSSIMLARKQVEFLFLFLIAPIIYATSVCNKQRRGALSEQLVSLTLQSAVVILIINITALLTIQINETTFFTNSFQNMGAKSLLYLGCATFLLTGSQTINRFIGSNVSANSGREQLMSLMGFGRIAGGLGGTVGKATVGTGLIGAGATIKGANYVANKTGLSSALGNVSNRLRERVGNSMTNFGNSIGGAMLPDGSTMNSTDPLSRTVQKIGNSIRSHGIDLSKNSAENKEFGISKKISRGSDSMIRAGLNIMSNKKRPRHLNFNPYFDRENEKGED